MLDVKIFEVLPGNRAVLLPNTPVFTIIAVSNDFVRSTGVPREKLINEGFFEPFPESPLDPEFTGEQNMRASLEYILQHKAPHALPQQRYDVPNGDGTFTEKYWCVCNLPVLSEAGELLYLIHTAEDVTNQVKARQREAAHQKLEKAYQKIEESEQKYRRLYESHLLNEQRQSFLLRLNEQLRLTTDPIVIQYEAASLVAVHLGADRVGYAEDGGDGKTITITTDYTNKVPSLKGSYNYDDYGPALLQAFRKGQTVVRNDITNDPSLSEAEKAAHATLGLGATVNVPLLKNGQLVAIFFMHFGDARQWTEEEVLLMQEVAERTWEAVVRARTEQALRQSEGQFRLMADTIPQSIWITNAEGQTEFLNKHWCDYCGEVYSDTTASDIAIKHLHPEDGPKVMQAFGEGMQTGEPWEVEQRNRSREGEYRWFLNRATPYRDPTTGSIIKWFGVGIDIHDRKLAEDALRASEDALEKKILERTLELEKANQELKRSNANLEEFAYAASHDMKEPIRKIHFFTDRLKTRLGEKLVEEDLHYFSRMEAAARRMSTLIEDLLKYSHISKGISQLEVVDLNQTLQLVKDDMELILEEKRGTIIAGDLPTIKGHRRQLQQLFENLIGNAFKYSKPDVITEVVVTTRLITGVDTVLPLSRDEAHKSFHLFEVKDNGIGFEQADAERIFNVFTRLHGTTQYKGTGVGLSIVRKVAENHGGHVWATSEVEKGANFHILLPVDELNQ